MNIPFETVDRTFYLRTSASSSLPGEKCELHNLCSACKTAFRRSIIVRSKTLNSLLPAKHHGHRSEILMIPPNRPWITAPRRVEGYKLHSRLEDLEHAVEYRCHFCTLVFDGLKHLKGGLAAVQSPISSVWLWITRDELARLQLGIALGCSPRLEEYHVDALLKFSSDSARPTQPQHAAQRCLATSSTEHAQLVRQWLQDCLLEHHSCRKTKHTSFVPTRLLQIRPAADGVLMVRLVITGNEERHTRYCALSHCWGQAQDVPRLTQATLAELQQPFESTSLPRTFRDAVSIAYTLVVGYLWIDSLCIMQDSADDWTREATTMQSVYENSTCTIAAADSENPHGGCLYSRDPLTYVPCNVPYSKDPPIYAHSPARPSGQFHNLYSSPLMRRAWIVQERFLSPRILFCGKLGMFWMCSAGVADEREPLGCTRLLMKPKKLLGQEASFSNFLAAGPDPRPSFHVQMQHLLLAARNIRLDSANPSHLAEFYCRWWKVIGQYTRCQMTRSADKLVALSGMANRVQAEHGKEYIAGLWKHSLLLDLLWLRDWHQDTSNSSRVRPPAYRAPSWSWAAVDGPIAACADYWYRACTAVRATPMAEVLEISLSTHSSDLRKTGQIFGGHLTLAGVIKKIDGLSDLAEAPTWKELTMYHRGYSIGRLTPDILPLPPSTDVVLMPLLHFSLDWPPRPPKPIGIGRDDECILGLALKTYNGMYYERLGAFQLFHLHTHDNNLQFFDNSAQQVITIR